MQRLALTVLVTLAAAIGAGPAGAATPAHFKSPSGNINCYVVSTDGGFADCVVRKPDWAQAPRKPRSCNLDFDPYEVQLTPSGVSIGACRGDVGPLCYTGNGRCSVLAYGHRITLGTIRCSSATSGVTCRRTTGTRPGFRVAREGVIVYR